MAIARWGRIAVAMSLAEDAYVIERGRVVLHGPGRELLDSEAIRSAYLGVVAGPRAST